MKAVPMIFNTETVKALLDGRKTVTRRPTKKEVTYSENGGFCCDGYMFGIGFTYKETMKNFVNSKHAPCKVGDLIWVRETFCHQPCANAPELTVYKSGYPQLELSRYESIMSESEIKWTRSIHMPRWASRLTLRVTDVRIERVQDITQEQAKKEGIRYHWLYNEWGGLEAHPYSRPNASIWRWYKQAVTAFERLWNSIYSNWDENPYVWVIEFEVIRKNIDQVIEEVSA